MRRIVCDTGPLLHLSEVQALNLLSLAEEMHVPKGVEAKVAYHAPTWHNPTWLVVDTLTEPPSQRPWPGSRPACWISGKPKRSLSLDNSGRTGC